MNNTPLVPFKAKVAEESLKEEEEHKVHTLFELSGFQREKLTYFFNMLDQDQDGVFSLEDAKSLIQKMVAFAYVASQTEMYSNIEDITINFRESLVDKCAKEDIGLEDWLDVWAVIMRRCMAVTDFPYWVQLFCKLIFEVIDKDRDAEISKQELYDYYANFIGIDPEHLKAQTEKGYQSMTANGTYSFSQDLWGQMFANMILGRDIYGPGEYVFGVFDINRKKAPFKLVIPKYEDEDDSAPSTPGEETLHPVRRMSSNNKIPRVPKKRIIVRSPPAVD